MVVNCDWNTSDRAGILAKRAKEKDGDRKVAAVAGSKKEQEARKRRGRKLRAIKSKRRGSK